MNEELVEGKGERSAVSGRFSVRERFDGLLEELLTASRRVHGDRLVSPVVFESVGRDTSRPDSDVDLLLVAEPLPGGRDLRVAKFEAVEDILRPQVAELLWEGIHTRFSPPFKTSFRAGRGNPLFLDMFDDGRILTDPADLFAGILVRLRKRLSELGARCIWRGDAWYWNLKPDYKRREVFEIFP
ncbi:MAG: hypothetical protein ACM3JH_01080 [Acidithiobacillales bacterium]